MRQMLRLMSCAALACLALDSSLPAAAKADDCRPAALATLRALSPDGYAVYGQITDKDFFKTWITCDNVQLGLSTAVHESVHYITAEIDAFPLVGGGAIVRPHEVSAFFAPSMIAKAFGSSDFATTYLRPGRSSSASDFLYLLDELNAYTHDLQAAVDLNRQHPAGEEVDNRDGLAAAMAFVAIYVRTARDSHPSTWAGLQTPRVAKTMATLWDGAEKAMTASCGIPDFGAEDKPFIRRFCQADVQSSLETIIGHAPVCPAQCLKGSETARQDGEDADDTTAPTQAGAAAVHLSAVRSYWRSGTRRHAVRSGDADTDDATTP